MGHTLRPPTATYGGEFGGGECGLLQALVHTFGVFPREQDLRGRTRSHRQLAADRHGVTKSSGAFCGGNAHPEVTLTAEELGGFAGDVAQACQDRSGGSEQSILACRGREFAESRSEDEASLHVTCDESMVFERDGKAVCGWPGKPRAGHEASECRGPCFECGQNECGFVKNADSARVVHTLILPYRIVRRKLTRQAGHIAANDEERAMGRTLAEKVWEEHVVRRADGEPDLLFIDLHLIHEVTSPQAFEGLRISGRQVRRPDLTLATEDHNIPTTDLDKPIADLVSRTQVETLRRNCEEFGVRLHPMGDIDQGIVHIIGPQLGLTQPGMTIVCGDSHTSTHGAFGSIAFGIGTSEVEHVLATQSLPQSKPKMMAVTVEGELPEGSTAKDLILALITQETTAGGQGYIVEYRGKAIRDLSMEARMTICNMSIEWGARAGLIAPDVTTYEYLLGRPNAPKGADWDAAVKHWDSLVTDEDAVFDKEIVIDASTIAPFVTWGTNPGQGVPLSGNVPNPEDFEDPNERIAAERALVYMGLEAGTPMRDIDVDTVFIGSCTNGRIEDLRVAAALIKGHKVAENTRILVVPGSVRVLLQAQEEGLDVIFKEAGAEWRGAGCSMCLGMNPDQLAAGERCASTSNRNFEGRQGKGGRTHLVSPDVAVATGILGHLASPADLVAAN